MTSPLKETGTMFRVCYKFIQLFSAGLFALYFCASLTLASHSHAQSPEDHVHACAVCQNAAYAMPTIHSPIMAPWQAFQSHTYCPLIFDLPVHQAETLVNSIRGPPLA